MTRDEFRDAVIAAVEDEAQLEASAEQLADVLQAAQAVGGPKSAERRAAVKALWADALGGRVKEPAAISVRRRVERIVRIREGAPATPKPRSGPVTASQGEGAGGAKTVVERIGEILDHLAIIATVEQSVSGLTAEEVGGLKRVSEAVGAIRLANRNRGTAPKTV